MLVGAKLLMSEPYKEYIQEGLVYHGENLSSLRLDVVNIPNYTFIAFLGENPAWHLIEFGYWDNTTLFNNGPTFRITYVINGSSIITLPEQPHYTDRPNCVAVLRDENAYYKLYVNGMISPQQVNPYDNPELTDNRWIVFRKNIFVHKFMVYNRVLSKEELDYNLSVWNQKNGY